MASGQARIPASDRREQILEVATRLFAQQGFQGTTTREIARTAGVNEALVFRHFPTKQELYWAVIERKIESSAPADRLQEMLDAGGDDLEVFQSLAEQILERRAKDDTLSRLLLFSGLEQHDLSERFFAIYSMDYFERLARYIRRRTREGSFRNVNPLLAARAFVGMVVHHSWVQDIFGGKRFHDFSIKETSRTLAQIWLGGMQSPAIRPAVRPSKRTGKSPLGKENTVAAL